MRSVGYRQVWSWLRGECSRDEMVARGQAATRQLAKRQMTWFRREHSIFWFSMEDSRQCYLEASRFLGELGIGGDDEQA